MRPERFELPTCCSGGNRSIQLSYGRTGVYSLHGSGGSFNSGEFFPHSQAARLRLCGADEGVRPYAKPRTKYVRKACESFLTSHSCSSNETATLRS